MKLRKAVVGLLTGALLMGALCCTPAMAEDVTDYKIGVSIMELTAYTWYQGVIDGCKQWLEENGEAKGVNLDFDFEDSRSDVQTMLTNLDNMVAAGSDGIILFPADASSAIPTSAWLTGSRSSSVTMRRKHPRKRTRYGPLS